jgi:Glycosyl hydrolase family 26
MLLLHDVQREFGIVRWVNGRFPLSLTLRFAHARRLKSAEASADGRSEVAAFGMERSLRARYRSGVVRIVVWVVVALGSPLTGAGASSGDHPGPLEPSAGVLFGAYVKPKTGWDRTDVEAAVEGLEGRLGRALAIDHHYYPRSVPFPSWKEPWDHSRGRIPMITWQGVSTRTVNSGALDAVIASRAEGVRDLGFPVFLRWFAEMDGDFQARRSGSPADYIRAWRRIRWIFATRGAWNAVWVWCPTAWGFVTGRAQRYYPGDAYVDWVCADGYNWAPGRKRDRWRSFEEIYEAFYSFGVGRGKPMLAGEYGCQEREPGEKAAWFDGARETVKQRFPDLRAVVYFDSDRDYDWRVDTSPSAFEAFAAMGADPYFHPPPESLNPVDPHRFDAVLGDVTPPRFRFLPPRGLRAGEGARIRWSTDEPHADRVLLRYQVRGGGRRPLVRRTADDGSVTWAVPAVLEGTRIRLWGTAVDLAGNRDAAGSRWLRVG